MRGKIGTNKQLIAGKYRHTSISLREISRRRVKAAVQILRRNGVSWSESEILQRLAKFYLSAWRGQGEKADSARRYNAESGRWSYVRMAWYVDRVIYAALWERSTHAGQSISRMLDFAIRYYLPRLVEIALSNPYNRNKRAVSNFVYWDARCANRMPKRPERFVTYAWITTANDSRNLIFNQETRLWTSNELFAQNFPPPDRESA